MLITRPMGALSIRPPSNSIAPLASSRVGGKRKGKELDASIIRVRRGWTFASHSSWVVSALHR
ncbi:hypothetical protein D3C85_1902640 [compost metagenome]